MSFPKFAMRGIRYLDVTPLPTRPMCEDLPTNARIVCGVSVTVLY